MFSLFVRNYGPCLLTFVQVIYQSIGPTERGNRKFLRYIDQTSIRASGGWNPIAISSYLQPYEFSWPFILSHRRRIWPIEKCAHTGLQEFICSWDLNSPYWKTHAPIRELWEGLWKRCRVNFIFGRSFTGTKTLEGTCIVVPHPFPPLRRSFCRFWREIPAYLRCVVIDRSHVSSSWHVTNPLIHLTFMRGIRAGNP